MVARYSEVMGRALGLPPKEIADLVYVARVHDVGKIFVPDRILNKPSPLTEDEFYLVKVHARVGAEIVGTLPDSEICGGPSSIITRPSTGPAIRQGCAERKFRSGRGFWQSRTPTPT